MSDTMVTLADPHMKDIGPVGPRDAQYRGAQHAPEGGTIVSADNHWEIESDIFVEKFPKHLVDDAPRVWFDRYWHIGYPGTMEAYGTGDRIARVIQRGIGVGCWNAKVRADQLSAEGIHKEIVYPQSLLGFRRYPRYDIQEHMYRAYNEYMAERSEAAPDSFYGVGIFGNWWDPQEAESCMRQIMDLGLKTFMLPVTAGKDPNGKTLTYGGPEMERFWDVVAEAGLAVGFHIGENPDADFRGGQGTAVVNACGELRKPLAQLIFGGVFDRHPDLQVVFAEGGLAWVLAVLQDCEMVFDSYGNGDMLDKIELRPSEYWHRNCYATFQNDALGLREIEHLGVDRVMWGADYPHSEGSFGFSWDSRQTVIDTLGPDAARKILGGTAKDLYGL